MVYTVVYIWCSVAPVSCAQPVASSLTALPFDYITNAVTHSNKIVIK